MLTPHISQKRPKKSLQFDKFDQMNSLKLFVFLWFVLPLLSMKTLTSIQYSENTPHDISIWLGKNNGYIWDRKRLQY